jgi:formate-dependent nitrite reductase membrane component NrfD
MLVTPLSFIWSAIHIKEVFPKWDWKFKILKDLEAFFTKQKVNIAWVMGIASIILGVYTGILFSAFNARPLWNTSVLGLLFLSSGLSAGAATIMLFSKKHQERTMFAKIDIGIILVELFLIIHMFMGFLASTQVQINAAELFLGGPWTAPFWIFVVILGMIVPVFLEVLELKKFKIPVVIPAGLVLFGSLMLRFIIAYAGQESRWLY